MKKDRSEFRKDVAFINRQKEIQFLEDWINERPESILFIHGPKSSGKTTLLYKFLENIKKHQALNVKFLNLRETFTNVYEDFLKTFFHVEKEGEKKENLGTDINVGFFKITAAIEKKILEKRADPFKVMKAEFLKLSKKGIKPILIIDELQALDKIYIDHDKERLLIIALFNFFVAMTKESHLAHVIVASSDGYFINKIFTDSKLKKTSDFFKVDYLEKNDVMEWLLNLEKYSKIKDYTLTKEEAEKIWDALGGSMWEIQRILSARFETTVDKALNLHLKKISGIIAYYTGLNSDKKKILHKFISKTALRLESFTDLEIENKTLETLLDDMVRNNILYFDPTEATYLPQGKSYQQGIKLYFDSLSPQEN